MADAACSDNFAQVRGFRVDIDGVAGKEHDVAWEHVSGGALIIEHVETTIGSDKFQTHSPGHKTVGEITLRGAMTGERDAMCQWLDDTTAGRDWTRTLTITELLSVDGGVKAGKQYIYFECFPVAYVFPTIDSRDPCPPVEELRLSTGRAS